MSVLDENWDYDYNIHSIEDSRYKEFQIKVSCLHENISKLLGDGFRVQKYNYSNVSQSHDNELKDLIDRNKYLQQQIDEKVKDLSQKTTQYENYKKDQKLLSHEIKERHEAFLMAKKCYKKFLKMYYTIESKNSAAQSIYLQFFTESKKESESYSVRLVRNCISGHYQLIDATPKLHNFKELQQILQDTNDVPGALCCIRLSFKAVKGNKKL